MTVKTANSHQSASQISRHDVSVGSSGSLKQAGSEGCHGHIISAGLVSDRDSKSLGRWYPNWIHNVAL